MATPTISLEKSSYTIGETAIISWVASPAESDFKHYWLVIKNTTNGKTYYGTATGGDGDVSANHYDLAITESGVYKVDVYAVDHGGGGKSDSKTFGVGKYEITTPSISFDKSSYIEGETAKITWTASLSESDLKHYWLVIKNTTNGKTYYGTATGGDDDVNANHYDLPLTESGTYKVDVYAVDHGGGGKSDSKTFIVEQYELTTPTITFDKNVYMVGETAKITWEASPAGSKLKHYWIVIKNTTIDKLYYGTATGGDGDVNANHYDLPLTESGTYKVDVYAVNQDGSGKTDSKTINVVQYDLTTPNISFDKDRYIVGDTAKITWSSSPTGPDFKHYWLVIKNTTSDKLYYGTATGGDGDVNANHYDLPLTESGTYKVDVYAVNRDGSGKSDSKTFVVSKELFEIGDTNLDGNISISDVTAIQRHLAELAVFNDEQLSVADTNGDGEINISDATHLQMYLAEYGVILGKQT
ncbi:MAG: dockerin type I domain-containing protein [Ruminococcus sp.]|nr:dockerin type I domain-containing protein [Ruminococcus sp.]